MEQYRQTASTICKTPFCANSLPLCSEGASEEANLKTSYNSPSSKSEADPKQYSITNCKKKKSTRLNNRLDTPPQNAAIWMAAELQKQVKSEVLGNCSKH